MIVTANNYHINIICIKLNDLKIFADVFNANCISSKCFFDFGMFL